MLVPVQHPLNSVILKHMSVSIIENNIGALKRKFVKNRTIENEGHFEVNMRNLHAF